MGRASPARLPPAEPALAEDDCSGVDPARSGHPGRPAGSAAEQPQWMEHLAVSHPFPPFGSGDSPMIAVMDLGDPISYEVLASGTKVFSSDEAEIGRVVHVLAAEDEDVFDGIVIDEQTGPGGRRFADADQIDAIYEHGVVLNIDRSAAKQLPEPSANPAVLGDDPADPANRALAGKLRRAWDYISGNY
jgi:hypothetical protein